MPTRPAESNREFWFKQSRAVCRRINLAWWLESMTGPLVVLSLVGGAALLWIRREYPATPDWIPATCCAAAIAILAIVCRLIASKKFESPQQSLVRIEASMLLRSTLSAADAGVTPWPPPPSRPIDAGLRWQPARLWVPLLGSTLLLAAGLWIPVTARQANPTHSPEHPQAWTQLATELDQLTKEQVVDEPYLEETKKKLEELKAQKEEQWFSHSSLEATDSLKKAHRAESERVQRELDRADKSLGNLQKNTTNETEKKRLMDEFQQALDNLQNGTMKPNPAMLEQMKQLASESLSQLTPEQLESLRKQLEANARKLKQANCEGEGECAGGEPGDEGDEGEGEGEGEDGEQDGEGDKPGRGGVTRGPGHDERLLGKQKDPVETGDTTGIQSKDLSKSVAGDLLQLQDGEHENDRAQSKILSGGETNASGKGGDRVWKESLDPEEQKVLKKFFE